MFPLDDEPTKLNPGRAAYDFTADGQMGCDMTKREVIAAQVLAGLAASGEMGFQDSISYAVRAADALIDALAAPRKEGGK